MHHSKIRCRLAAVGQSVDGKADFNELERELGVSGGSSALVLYLFDLLYLDGLDLRRATPIERKQVLAELLAPLDPDGAVRLSEHLEIDGAELRQHACAMGLEGIVSKRKDGRYESGRTNLWTKSPCKVRDTFAVAGWALKGTKLDGFYLAEERGGKLVYAGKIEGGWTEEEKTTCSRASSHTSNATRRSSWRPRSRRRNRSSRACWSTSSIGREPARAACYGIRGTRASGRT